jgi:hypothetical protein
VSRVCQLCANCVTHHPIAARNAYRRLRAPRHRASATLRRVSPRRCPAVRRLPREPAAVVPAALRALWNTDRLARQPLRRMLGAAARIRARALRGRVRRRSPDARSRLERAWPAEPRARGRHARRRAPRARTGATRVRPAGPRARAPARRSRGPGARSRARSPLGRAAPPAARARPGAAAARPQPGAAPDERPRSLQFAPGPAPCRPHRRRLHERCNRECSSPGTPQGRCSPGRGRDVRTRRPRVYSEDTGSFPAQRRTRCDFR